MIPLRIFTIENVSRRVLMDEVPDVEEGLLVLIQMEVLIILPIASRFKRPDGLANAGIFV